MRSAWLCSLVVLAVVALIWWGTSLPEYLGAGADDSEEEERVFVTMDARTVFDGGGEDVAWTERVSGEPEPETGRGCLVVRQTLSSGETVQAEAQRAFGDFPAQMDIFERSPAFTELPLAVCGVSTDRVVQVEIGRRHVEIPVDEGYAVGIVPDGDEFSLTEDEESWREILAERLEEARPAAVLRIENLGTSPADAHGGGDVR
ncbi:MAG: hypothetical protein R6U92_07260 [Bacillota bacterium]